MNTTASSNLQRLAATSAVLLFILFAEAILYQSEDCIVNHVHIIGIHTLGDLCLAIEVLNLLCAADFCKDKVGVRTCTHTPPCLVVVVVFLFHQFESLASHLVVQRHSLVGAYIAKVGISQLQLHQCYDAVVDNAYKFRWDTLTHKILEDAGYNVGLGGNIGKSFALSVATEARDWYVLELSSFQLDGMFDFRADVGVLMNITPDHLDRYNYKFENYAESKMRIAQNQTSEQTFVYMADDSNITSRLEAHAAEVTRAPFSKAMVGEDGIIRISLGDKEMEIDSNRLKIKGLHNMYNAMAASLAAMAAGVPTESILSTLYSFEGVEHRLEPAGVVDGVEYINDSKATNVDSVWYALGSMTRPTIWIAGGTDKGNDYEPLKELVYEKVKALVCMGLNNEKLVESFRGVVPVYPTTSLDEAMKVCRSVAKEGYTVLLSPACASFDLFKNYEDRGRQFKEYVKKMANNE